MFALLGRVVPRLRYLLVVVWLAAAGLSLFAPSLSSVSSADEASFLPRDAESMTARHVIAQAFPADAAQTSAEIVFERKSGLTDADKAYIENLGKTIDSVTGVSRYYSPGSGTNPAATYSSDTEMATAVINLDVAAYEPAANQAIDDIRSRVRSSLPNGLLGYVTGQAGFGRDYLKAIQDGTDRTTLVTIVLVVIVLLLIYRAPLAALVPLATIGLAYLVARGSLATLAQHGLQLSSVIDSFIVVLVFGVGTDYTIFLISRFREELAKAPLREATSTTISRIGAVITASAATVIVGLSAMVVARFTMIQTTGPALALTIFITLLAGLTLTPSLLTIFGRWLFWPFHPRPHTDEWVRPGVWARLANAISSHAGLLSVAVLIVLAAPLLALPQLKQSFDVPSELPANADSRIGFDIIGEHIGVGQLLRMSVLVNDPNGDLSSPTDLRQILALETKLRAIGNVNTVSSVVDPAGTKQVPAGLHPATQLKTLANSFSTPPSSDINTQLSDASLNGVRDAKSYVAGLMTAYPGAVASGTLVAATNDLAAIEQGLVQMRQAALVANQLNAIDAQLQSAASAAGASNAGQQLAQLKAYLGELGKAYPDAAALPEYGQAESSIAALSGGAANPAAFLQLRGSIQALSIWFAALPSAAYFAPTSTPVSSDMAGVAQTIADARGRLPGELIETAKSFEPDDLYLPPASDASAGSSGSFRSIYLSSSGDVTRLFITTTSDPYDAASFATVNDIRSQLALSAPDFGSNAELYLGGPTAEFADIQRTMNEDFVLVAAFTIAGILIVLAILLRSLFAPIYLVATVLLSYLTSLSLSALILQRGFGQPGLNYFIPIMVFVLLVALGSDYNIFLMSRIREEAAMRGLRPGLRVASARTGTVITSAGLILAGTFGALVTSPLQLLFQVGLTVALGVLLDTFIVRSLLVPALTTVFGRWAWWPSPLGTVAAEAAIGGAGLTFPVRGLGPDAPASRPTHGPFVAVEPAAPAEAVEMNGHAQEPIEATGDEAEAVAVTSGPAEAGPDVQPESPPESQPQPTRADRSTVRSHSALGGAIANAVRVLFPPRQDGHR